MLTYASSLSGEEEVPPQWYADMLRIFLHTITAEPIGTGCCAIQATIQRKLQTLFDKGRVIEYRP